MAAIENSNDASVPTPAPVKSFNVEKKSEDLNKGNVSEGNAEELASQKTASMKTMTDGHSSLKVKLKRARKVLSAKTRRLRELENAATRLKERNWLTEEKIRSLTERENAMSRKVDEKEKRQEDLFAELSETKWKLTKGQQFIQKLKSSRSELKKKQAERQEQIIAIESPSIKKLFEDVKLLKSYKTGLAKGDPELVAIKSGTKMENLEQKKRALQDSFGEREIRTEAMYAEIAELHELIEKKLKSIERRKKDRETKLWQAKNQLRCLAETEERFKRSAEYIQAKIDFGMNVPPPAPWPNFKIDK